MCFWHILWDQLQKLGNRAISYSLMSRWIQIRLVMVWYTAIEPECAVMILFSIQRRALRYYNPISLKDFWNNSEIKNINMQLDQWTKKWPIFLNVLKTCPPSAVTFPKIYLSVLGYIPPSNCFSLTSSPQILPEYHTDRLRISCTPHFYRLLLKIQVMLDLTSAAKWSY